MIVTRPTFFIGENVFIKGPTNRIDGELVVGASGSSISITSRGFKNRQGVFQPGAPAVFIGAGEFASSSTPFLVASSSTGPVFSISDRLYAQNSGSQFIVTVSGTILVETKPNQFTDIRDLVFDSSSIMGLYAIETATNALVSASFNLNYSSSLLTASLTSISSSLAQKEVSDQTALSASLISVSASLAQKEVVDQLTLTSSLISTSASLAQYAVAASASIASQAISFSASLSSTEISHSASLAASITSLSASQAQFDASASVVDAVNKIKLPTSTKTQDGLYLESSSMGFFNVSQAQYPVVINAAGQFRFADSASYVGGSDPYSNVVGFANGAFLVRTDKLMLQTPSLMLIGANTASAASNALRLGPSATTMSFTDKLGSYLDGAGNFRVGTDTTGSEFLQFGPSVGLVIKAKRAIIDAGGAFLSADTSSVSSGHQFKVGVNAGGLTLTSGSGFYVDGAGNIRAGDPAATFIEFTPSNAFRVVTNKLVMDAGGLYMLAHPASGSSNALKIGASANAISLGSGVGIYADGGGNFRAGDPTANFFEFTTGNALRLVTTKLLMDAGGVYILAHPASGSTNVIKLATNASGVTLANNQGVYADGAGNFRVGSDTSGSNFVEFTAANAFRLKTTKLEMDATGLYLLAHPASGSTNAIKLAQNASELTLTKNRGFYVDGAGNFRVGTDTTGSNFIMLDSSNALFISASNFFLNAGTGGNNLQINQFQMILGNSVSPGVWPFPYNSSTFNGFYANNQGQIFVGDATQNYFQFGGQVMEIKSNAFVLKTPGFQFSSSFSGSGGDLRAGSATALSTGVGGWLGGDGTFRAGNPAGAQIKWDGTSLTVSGSINITGGNAATQAYAISTAGNATSTASLADTALSGAISSSFINNPIGFITKITAPAGSGLYLGSDKLGFYNGSAWKTYMDNSGQFFLSGTGANTLSWDGTTLSINGAITVTGGNAATQTFANSAAATAQSNAQSFATSADSTLSGSVAANIFTNTAGSIIKAPSPSGTGLFLGSTNMGYYTGGAWTTYFDNTGHFQFQGNGSNLISWDGSTFTVKANTLDINASNFRLIANSSGSSMGIGGATAFVGAGLFIDNTGNFSVSGSSGGLAVNRNAFFDNTSTIIWGGLSVDSLFPFSIVGQADIGGFEHLRMTAHGAVLVGANLAGRIDLTTSDNGSTAKTWMVYGSGSLLPPTGGIIGDASHPLTSVLSNAYFTTSKRELKTDIVPLALSALDLINKIDLFSFRYKTDQRNETKIGFMADDTHDLLSGQDHDRMDHANAIGLLLKATQELDKKIKELNDRL